MSDNLTFQTTALATVPDATIVATDDAGAAGHVQVVKLAVSTNGSATPLTADNTDGLLVNLGANNDVTVTSGSVTANAGTNLNTSLLALEAGGNLAASATSLGVIDDWDESDRAKVNPIVGQAGVQGGSGAVSATTQRVVLATDVALPAGTNAIGKLAANSGVDIGDVDVTSVAGTGTNAASQVTVTNSSGTIIAARSGRRGVLLVNQQTVAVYVDPSGGTAATTHFRLDPGASVFLPVTSAVTGITSAAYSASGDAKVHVIELY